MADPIAAFAVSSCFLLPFVYARWFATVWPAPEDDQDEPPWSP